VSNFISRFKHLIQDRVRGAKVGAVGIFGLRDF
jgi:hypothetical protein